MPDDRRHLEEDARGEARVLLEDLDEPTRRIGIAIGVVQGIAVAVARLRGGRHAAECVTRGKRRPLNGSTTPGLDDHRTSAGQANGLPKVGGRRDALHFHIDGETVIGE